MRTEPIKKMLPTRALAYLCNLTSSEWRNLEINETIALWGKLRDYVLNNYREYKTTDRVQDAWERCKAIIDQEIKRQGI